MKNLELQKCILGPVYTNCYLLKNKETGELIIVDPADCPEKIEMKISRMNGKPVVMYFWRIWMLSDWRDFPFR